MCRIAAVALACLLFAACGGGTSSPSGGAGHPAGPKIARAVAFQLASQADRVAADLRAHDGCRARDDAALLQRAASDAIVNGDVPAPLAAPVASSVAALAERIVCHPPTPPGREHHHHGHGDGNGQGDGGG
jgi:hypothetical protein